LGGRIDSNQAKAAKQEEMLVEMKATADADRDDRKTDMHELNAKMDANMMKMAAIRSELEETMEHQLQHILSYVNQGTQNLRRELTETIKKTQLELQTVEVCLDKRTRDVEENIAAIIDDITANKRRFQCYQ
jgi:uncharacterized membrane protein YdfJ with MMPL/SSD domain